MQNPIHAVDIVLQEAIENPGKVDLAVDLLSKLPTLEKYKISEKLIPNLEDCDSDCIPDLIIKLSEKNDIFAKEICQVLLEFALKNQQCTLIALEIISKLEGYKKSVRNSDIILCIDKVTTCKKSRTILDGQVQNLLHEFVQDSKGIDKDDQLLKLSWIKPDQWNGFDSAIEVLDNVITVIDFIEDSEHKLFIIKQLSEFLGKKVEDYFDHDNLLNIHDKVVFLMNMLCTPDQKFQSLQNCQTKLLSLILEKKNENSEQIDFEHLISVIATIPNCDAKNLSLTKLKMILDVTNKQ